jgi:hypothetical protein
MQPLAETPHEIRETVDDTEARAWLVQLGHLDRLLEMAHAGLPEPRAEMICDTNHPTHWVFGVYYHGYPLTADNGYTVRCFPKSEYTLEKFKRVIRGQIGGNTPIDFQQTWDGSPPPRFN